jgi:hypothetical protein
VPGSTEVSQGRLERPEMHRPEDAAAFWHGRLGDGLDHVFPCSTELESEHESQAHILLGHLPRALHLEAPDLPMAIRSGLCTGYRDSVRR